MRQQILPALKVLGNIVTLIDTKNSVFTFKYHGPIRAMHGIESYARKMITDCCPAAQEVVFKTNRVRDERDV
ncbi:unnamed protein product [Phaeothamnion confervicola]